MRIRAKNFNGKSKRDKSPWAGDEPGFVPEPEPDPEPEPEPDPDPDPELGVDGVDGADGLDGLDDPPAGGVC